MVKVFCKNTGSSLEFQEGVNLSEVLDAFEFDKPYDVLCAKVNHVTQGLKYRVFNNRDVEFLDYRSYAGRSSYCRSLCFLASKAARDLWPGCRITMRRPISKGYFCNVEKEGGPMTLDDVDALTPDRAEFVMLPPIVAGTPPATLEAIRRLHARGVNLLCFESCAGLEDLFGVKPSAPT